MDRPLVITNESARHPLRRMLPPPVVPALRDQDQDLRLFALSFTAFFICFYTFFL